MAKQELFLVLLSAIVALATACGGDGSDGSDPDSATEVVRERDGVRMTLSLDKEKYGPDATVQVGLTIENTTQGAVEYRGETPYQPGLTLTLASNLASPQPLTEPGPEDISGTLAAGARIERTAEWDKLIKMTATPLTAPPGMYTVNAGFLMAREGFADLTDLGAAVSFEVEGTPYIQPPLEAVRALIASEEVKAWAQGRGDNVICAYPAHDYFYNGLFTTGQAAETFDFLYKSQLESGLPICGFSTEGDAWRLVLFSPAGGEPHRLTVYVALERPEVLRVVQGGPTSAPTATPQAAPQGRTMYAVPASGREPSGPSERMASRINSARPSPSMSPAAMEVPSASSERAP